MVMLAIRIGPTKRPPTSECDQCSSAYHLFSLAYNRDHVRLCPNDPVLSCKSLSLA